jgi:phosphate transport system substrate-binding protein
MLAYAGTAVAAEQTEPQGRPVVDSAIGSYVAKADVSGAVAIAGSDTMQPIIARIASAFKQWQPDVKIAVQGGGTDAALLQFLQDQSTIRRGDANPKGHLVSGSIALLASSRSFTDKERKDFQSRYGYEPTEIPIALDAVAIYVHRQNPVEGITMEQLDAIFGRDRKRGASDEITTWGQVGLKDEWAGQPIHLYGRDPRSGTRTFFKQAALLDGEFRGTVREEIGYASEILAISRDALAIGYAGIGFQSSYVRVVPVAEKTGALFVAPSAESAASGAYPLSRHLYLYAKRDPKTGLEPAVLEFLKFVNSREGQEMVAKSGAYPLPAQETARNLQALGGATTSAATAETLLLAGKSQ